jgi:hypothetical protein
MLGICREDCKALGNGSTVAGSDAETEDLGPAIGVGIDTGLPKDSEDAFGPVECRGSFVTGSAVETEGLGFEVGIGMKVAVSAEMEDFL